MEFVMRLVSLFDTLGLDVLSESGGVYHCRQQGSEQEDCVLLLLIEAPLAPAWPTVKVFMQEVPAKVEPRRMIAHWQNLDARRLEESGLHPVEMELAAEQAPNLPRKDVSFRRPDGLRLRHTAVLTTGEVVCYN